MHFLLKSGRGKYSEMVRMMSINIASKEREHSLEKEIDIEEIRFYRGPNKHALFPVMEAYVRLGDLVDEPSSPYFADILAEQIEDIKEHTCSKDRKGGFLERLVEGTYPGHIVEHVTLALQNTIGMKLSYGKCRRVKDDLYLIVMGYECEKTSEKAVRAAAEIVTRLYRRDLEIEGFIRTELKDLKGTYERERLGPSTAAIIQAARKRKIPSQRLDTEYSLFSLGWGRNRKMIWGPETSDTSLIGSEIGKEKDVTKNLLERSGVPVPRGEVVRSLEAALDFAEYIGYPVVLKPVAGHHGDNVMVNLKDAEELEESFHVVKEESDYVLVEKYVEGGDYRCLVIGHKVVAVAKRIPAHVIGDGSSSIKELVELVNKDPKRGAGHISLLTELKLEDEELMFLKHQGKSVEDIPGDGEVVYLRATANLSTGGTAEDYTEAVHPLMKRKMERISKIIGLDVMGVDVIAEDMTLPPDQMRWAVIEANSSPGLRMHLSPTDGTSLPVGEMIVKSLFPVGDGRIPVVAITGTNGKTTTARLVEWIARQYGYHTGLAVTGGIYSNGDKITEGDTTGPWSAQVLLGDPEIEFAVLETARGGIVKRGLGFDRCSVGVVTNIREDHIGLNGVEDLEDLFWIKSLVLETTEEGGHCVINGNDDFAERLVERANGQIVLFSMEKNTLIDKNISAGVPVFVLEGEELFAYIDGEPMRLAHVSEIPFLVGTVSMMVENTLAALATAYSSGFPLEKAVEALKIFETNEEMCPGRLNLYDVNGVKVLFDYAHNQDALIELANYVKGLERKKTKFIYTGLGDRSDVSMIKNGFEAGKHFDELIFSEKDDQLRGRESGVISSLLNIGAEKAGKEPKIILDHHEALAHVIEKSSEGDLVVCANLDYTSEDLQQFIMKAEEEEVYIEEIKALSTVETPT